MRPTREITEDEVDAFWSDGVVPLRQVLPLGWVDELRVAMDEVFDRDLESGRRGLVEGRSTTGARSDMVQGALQLLERPTARPTSPSRRATRRVGGASSRPTPAPGTTVSASSTSTAPSAPSPPG